MRVACSRCQTKYDVPDEKLSRGAAKIRCSECGNVFLVRKRGAAPEEEPEPSQEAKFEDFDFDSFGAAEPPESGPAPGTAAKEELDLEEALDAGEEGPSIPLAPEPPAEEDLDSLDDRLSSIGELDLGDFEDLDDDLNLNDLHGLDLGGEDDDLSFPDEHPGEEREPLERVREEDLLGDQPRAAPAVQGVAEDMPRLDIQRGPRRAEGSSPSPVQARDRRHSPLLWLVVVAAVATLGFTGFMLYTKRDAAFTFHSPSKIRSLWQRQTAAAQLEAVEQRGFYKDLPAGRRMFVIQGGVNNRTGLPQSLIKVRGELFGTGGQSLAMREVFCGNVLSEHELATLPVETIEARLQNEVGEGLSNVDIAPSATVPFMVVFPSPPDGVEKFNVTVIQAETGAGT